jgi:hypothetical protein
MRKKKAIFGRYEYAVRYVSQHRIGILNFIWFKSREQVLAVDPRNYDLVVVGDLNHEQYVALKEFKLRQKIFGVTDAS